MVAGSSNSVLLSLETTNSLAIFIPCLVAGTSYLVPLDLQYPHHISPLHGGSNSVLLSLVTTTSLAIFIPFLVAGTSYLVVLSLFTFNTLAIVLGIAVPGDHQLPAQDSVDHTHNKQARQATHPL